MQSNALANIPAGSFTGTLVGLFEKGLRYSTVIDVGCADGHFYVYHCGLGLFAGATALNIDANAIYEDSLKSIREVLGGHYVIAAASDRAGEVTLTTSAHPYWGSLVQGAEAQVLGGAREVLRHTHGVVCEADLDDFAALHQALVDAGFALFDVTQPHWLSDRSLGWFYPVYLNRALDRIRPRAFWDAAQNPAAPAMQTERRRNVRDQLARMLAEQKAARVKR